MDGELAGGIYGVAIGRMFFGESMFARRTDASKIAMAGLAAQLDRWGFPLIDCQLETAAPRVAWRRADAAPPVRRRNCPARRRAHRPRGSLMPTLPATRRTPRGPSSWRARRSFSVMIESWQIPRSANGSRPVPSPTSALEHPRLWKVLLHNDDYTTQEFVVWVLESIFHLPHAEAFAIMMHVHQAGVGVAGLFTRDVAETKVKATQQMAEQHEYPLLVTIEPECGGPDE